MELPIFYGKRTAFCVGEFNDTARRVGNSVHECRWYAAEVSQHYPVENSHVIKMKIKLSVFLISEGKIITLYDVILYIRIVHPFVVKVTNYQSMFMRH